VQESERNYALVPHIIFLLKKLIVTQVVKKLTSFYVTITFITVFTKPATELCPETNSSKRTFSFKCYESNVCMHFSYLPCQLQASVISLDLRVITTKIYAEDHQLEYENEVSHSGVLLVTPAPARNFPYF
jgi:hypothetical protein